MAILRKFIFSMFAFTLVWSFAAPTYLLAQEAERTGIDELDQYLVNILPEWLILGEHQVKDFKGQNGGRLSMAGELIVTEDLIKPNQDHSGLRAEMMSDSQAIRGLLEAAAYMAVRNGDGRLSGVQVHEFGVVIQAGTRIPFTGELPYLETVTGRTISGQILYQVPQHNEQVIPARNLPSNGYIVGGEGFTEIRSKAYQLYSQIDQFLSVVALDAFYKAFLQYGDKHIILVEYDKPAVQFTFRGHAFTEIADRVKFSPYSNLSSERVEVIFEIDLSPYPGAHPSYAQMLADETKDWKLILSFPGRDLLPQNLGVQLGADNVATGQRWQMSQFIQWNGEEFVAKPRWQIYPFDPN